MSMGSTEEELEDREVDEVGDEVRPKDGCVPVGSIANGSSA